MWHMGSKLNKLKVALNKYKESARAPFKEDSEIEVSPVKEAAPRAPFKGESANNLPDAIDQGYQSVLNYLKNSDGKFRSTFDEALDYELKLTPDQEAKYVSMFPNLYAHFNDELPYLLCGSVLEDKGIKVPVEAVLNLSLDWIIDEYFGTCYQPSRLASRFTPGFKEAVSKKIKQSIDLSDFMLANSAMIESALSIGGVDDVISIWGPMETKMWWRNADESVLEHLRDGMTDIMYESFVEKYGGGLI
jgi:hypothetical protein